MFNARVILPDNSIKYVGCGIDLDYLILDLIEVGLDGCMVLIQDEDSNLVCVVASIKEDIHVTRHDTHKVYVYTKAFLYESGEPTGNLIKEYANA